MTRILEFQPAEEDVVVTRVVTQIHKIVDREFPRAAPPPKRFARTLFSDMDEPTVNQPLPGDPLMDSDHRSSTPPPPPPHASRGQSHSSSSRRQEVSEAPLEFRVKGRPPWLIFGAVLMLVIGLILFFLTAP